MNRCGRKTPTEECRETRLVRTASRTRQLGLGEALTLTYPQLESHHPRFHLLKPPDWRGRAVAEVRSEVQRGVLQRVQVPVQARQALKRAKTRSKQRQGQARRQEITLSRAPGEVGADSNPRELHAGERN